MNMTCAHVLYEEPYIYIYIYIFVFIENNSIYIYMLKTYICDICICVLEKENMMIPWWKQK